MCCCGGGGLATAAAEQGERAMPGRFSRLVALIMKVLHLDRRA